MSAKAPHRSRRRGLKDQYTIVHVDNCESKHVVLEWDNNRLTIAEIDEVEAKVKQHNPEVLFSASMWSAEEAQQIHAIARSVRPDIKLHAIPEGLQVERGPDAIVEYLCEKVPVLLDS
ncbi:unnamed protein product [Penicillium salamii]|nr:unnamed protein product [Penicillium salamii]